MNTLSSGGSSKVPACIEYATKQSTPPIHKSIAKPPKRFLQNFIHSGVCLGGVKAFGPSRAKCSFAFSGVRPCHRYESISIH